MSTTERILRSLVRELWIVTAAAKGKRGGLAATWVSPASIDPERPVMLAGIAPNHFTAELIDASGGFALHLLRADQIETAWNFARDSGRDRDKLAGFAVSKVDGAPILADCRAWLDCRVIRRYDAGDRLFLWGEVVASGEVSQGPSLTDQVFFAALTPERRQHLLAARDADVAIHRQLKDSP